MYDKVKLWIDRTVVGGHFPYIVNYLDEANTQINHQTGEEKTFGSVNGLKVSIFVGGLSVVGSLPKYLYGSNVYTLDRHTTANAIEKLSDALHMQASRASVTGFEFGTNFLMLHKVPDYLNKLGDMPRLSRYHFEPTTLYYKGSGKQQPKVFAFYDKVSDVKAKGLKCPEDIKDANLLRYEMRLNGRLSQQLKVSEVTASTLSETPFYRMVVKRYQDSYFSISKTVQMKTNYKDEIKTVNDGYDAFVARLINQTDKSQIGNFLEELKDAKVFEDRKNYTRLKKKIENVASKANVTVSNELIKELDDDIKNCGAYV